LAVQFSAHGRHPFNRLQFFNGGSWNVLIIFGLFILIYDEQLMKVKGKVKFIDTEKSGFYAMLKKRVDIYFEDKQLSRYANGQMVIKTIVLLAAYLLPYMFLLTVQPSLGWSLVIWGIMGISLAGIGMSVMHDANHGAYSSKKSINTLVGFSLNLLGGSVFNWKLQHNILHHTYTNITGMDEDIDDRLVLKFSPHTPIKAYHRFQWMYAFLFYGLLTLYWAIAKDFIQFRQFSQNGLNPHSEGENRIILARIIAIKVFYFSLMFFLPLYAGIPLAEICCGFLLMHFFAGIILTTVFQLAHTLEHTSHPIPAAGVINNDWAIHQLNTTVNFAPGNKLVSWYVGGLNYQIEHHLFQKISHVHYPGISVIVKQTALEYGVPYLENKTVLSALRSHIAYLKAIGRMPDLNEALG
jgi:linoleoyl-CoA desaturase